MSLLLDLFGKGGTGRKFYVRDFKNAYKFRPDVNPARQKFQGYVNFIFNRELYESLYGNSGDFRATISSMVRTADLPGVTFNVETKNAYNRKKLIQTGVQYDPVNITVLDTVGNEWLSVLMKYFSYYYMDPRNLQDTGNRDIDAKTPRNGENLNAGSKFGFGSDVWDSNVAGYNPSITANFFERIDYVLYHGNKGVQYSLLNPLLTQFKPTPLDYSDSNFREFEMSFAYEKFTTYNVTNFDLDAEDFRRFENASQLTGPAFVADQEPISLTERELSVLGKTSTAPGERSRSGQPQKEQPAPPPSEESDVDRIVANSMGSLTNGGAVTTPTNDGDDQEITSGTKDLVDVYGVKAKFSEQSAEAKNGALSFSDVLLDVADTAVATLINGGDVKDAALQTLFGGATTLIKQQNSNFSTRNVDTSSPNQPDDVDETAPTQGGGE